MTPETAAFLQIIEKNPRSVFSLAFSKPAKDASLLRVKIRPLASKNGAVFYVEEFTRTQVFQRNLIPDELLSYVRPFADSVFRQAFMETAGETLTLLTAKKGKQTLIRKKIAASASENPKSAAASPVLRDRVKKYLIPEGRAVPFLVKLSVMNGEGKVLAAKYDKFRQINRFLEFTDDILQPLLAEDVLTENALAEDAVNKKRGRLSVIDFGCGKSYLTFAVYHFLTSRGLDAHVVGLDLKKSVVDSCSSLARECGYDNLRFFCADIATFDAAAAGVGDVFFQPDLVISLHACDTATDQTLSRAVKAGARAILAAPCCQHELNTALDKSACDSSLAALLDYGIVRERFASLATDVMRAQLLDSAGYKTQILEFIDTEHTPKNLLIRAVKKSGASADLEHAPDFPASYTHLRAALGCAPLLEKLLWQKN